MKIIDQSKIYKQYKGKWVVFDNNKIVASNKYLKKAIAEFEKKMPDKIPDVFKVPSKLMPYIGSN